MKWIALDINFDESPWLFVLSPASQLGWIKLLCHIKSYSATNGHCKAIDPMVASRKWGIGEEDVIKMLKAAEKDQALVIENGEWQISNWGKYQRDFSNERVKRFRERQAASDVTACNGTVTDVTKVTPNRDRNKDIETKVKDITQIIGQKAPDKELRKKSTDKFPQERYTAILNAYQTIRANDAGIHGFTNQDYKRARAALKRMFQSNLKDVEIVGTMTALRAIDHAGEIWAHFWTMETVEKCIARYLRNELHPQTKQKPGPQTVILSDERRKEVLAAWRR